MFIVMFMNYCYAGFIPILNNLITLGLYIDVSLSFKLQIQIAQLFCRLLASKDKELVKLPIIALTCL